MVADSGESARNRPTGRAMASESRRGAAATVASTAAGPARGSGSPAPSSPAATKMGKANRRANTRPERALRSALHELGMRFRIDRRVAADLRTRVDIAFGPAQVAVFVDGCFWHRCPLHGTEPKSNSEWWSHKLATNVQRDLRTNRALMDRGWAVIRVWEHDDPREAAARIAHIVQERRDARASESEAMSEMGQQQESRAGNAVREGMRRRRRAAAERS